jgi:hypothetical protein
LDVAVEIKYHKNGIRKKSRYKRREYRIWLLILLVKMAEGEEAN